MYILDRSGAVILSSRTAEGGSFYEYARSSRYADGSDSGYREVEIRTETVSGEGEEPSKAVTTVTDCFAGDITDSKGFLSWLGEQENVCHIYLKKQLNHKAIPMLFWREKQEILHSS